VRRHALADGNASSGERRGPENRIFVDENLSSGVSRSLARNPLADSRQREMPLSRFRPTGSACLRRVSATRDRT